MFDFSFWPFGRGKEKSRATPAPKKPVAVVDGSAMGLSLALARDEFEELIAPERAADAEREAEREAERYFRELAQVGAEQDARDIAEGRVARPVAPPSPPPTVTQADAEEAEVLALLERIMPAEAAVFNFVIVRVEPRILEVAGQRAVIKGSTRPDFDGFVREKYPQRYRPGKPNVGCTYTREPGEMMGQTLANILHEFAHQSIDLYDLTRSDSFAEKWAADHSPRFLRRALHLRWRAAQLGYPTALDFVLGFHSCRVGGIALDRALSASSEYYHCRDAAMCEIDALPAHPLIESEWRRAADAIAAA